MVGRTARTATAINCSHTQELVHAFASLNFLSERESRHIEDKLSTMMENELYNKKIEMRKKLERAFVLIDKDMSGELDMGELKSALEGDGCDSRELKAIFQSHILITPMAQMAFWVDAFDIIDTDGNGEVDFGELQE